MRAVDDHSTATWRNVIATTLNLLTFRAQQDELIGLSRRHLVFGLICTWIVGIGRYWDNPRVGFLQHLGVGSVVYIFLLALLLWLIVWPLRPENWGYFRVLTFLSLASPPAIIYAIPVEWSFPVHGADRINSFFLLIVAVWRVALLVFFLSRLAQLDILSLVVGTLLPLTLIVSVLTSLNLERAVFSLMGGLSEHTSSDSTFATLWLLAIASLFLFLPLLLCYMILIIIKTRSHLRSRQAARN